MEEEIQEEEMMNQTQEEEIQGEEMMDQTQEEVQEMEEEILEDQILKIIQDQGQEDQKSLKQEM